LRLAAHVALAAAPRALKVPIYRRVFGFAIDDSAQIGVSVLDVDRLELGPGSKIGHGNLLTRTHEVSLKQGAEIGFLNIIRGGDQLDMGAYSTVYRFNVLNSIPDHDCDGPTDSRLLLDQGAFVVSGHRLDFTDRIKIGKNVILAGRNSSFWTHNRQATRAIEIGDFCYVGSEVRVGPGARLGSFSILGMGGVLTGEAAERTVHGGVPAKPIRAITPEDEATLKKKTKKSTPPDAY
jgi:acetyltransferase-like isoleucine patch superfamily enzyme